MNNHFTILSVIVLFISACQSNNNKNDSKRFVKDSTKITTFIHRGDSIYRKKSDFSTFSKSLALYDSASHLAEKYNDTFLIAQAIFAKGRAYDAINNNPQKTIDYYSQAARLYATLPNMQVTALYIKHLVAHSYDKINDCSNSIKILRQLYSEILPKRTL